MGILVNITPEVQGSGEESFSSKLFSGDRVSIGRGIDNDLVLSEQRVSTQHATIGIMELDSGRALVVTDQDSSNGTYVEKLRLEAGVPFTLSSDQRVIIGSYVLSVEHVSSGQLSESHASDMALEPVDADGNAGASYDEEIELKQEIHQLLIERLDLRRSDIAALSDEELRVRARGVVEQILVDLRWKIPSGLNRESVIKETLDEALGLGPLETLLADDSVSEVMVNSYKQIYAERDGVLALTKHRFSSEQAVLGAIERIIAPIGRRIDESSPIVDARLKDGSRVNAVIRPLALNGPCITIRKFAKEALTIDRLVEFGSVSRGMADFLNLAVSNRKNVVISGGTGSGKTTLLNVLSGFIPDGERTITVEDAAELRLTQEHVVSFETRPPNLEGKGSIEIRDLVKNALRMRPDRIVVGECRGAEALDMLQAMNTGHDGSMTTGHANTPVDMIRRLETMVLTSGLDLPVRAVREQIGSSINFIVQQTRFSCGTRKITAITEILGMDYDDGTIMTSDVFLFKQAGYDANGKVKGVHQATGYIPRFFQELQERGLDVDASVFSPD